MPTPNSRPYGITAGPDGNLWFTEFDGNQIGRITPAGVISEFPVPTANSQPTGITAGPDGNLWFTEFTGNKIGRITPAGGISEFLIPTANSYPVGITAGPDGNLWFTEQGGNRIGRITPTGVLTEFPLPATSGPNGITAGPDGNLWFTDYNGNRIGRITPAGVITEFPVPTATSGPTGITAGPDGNLWFTELTGDKIGRITPAGGITEFLLTANSNPNGITAGLDGNLWFTELGGNQIGRITPTGVLSEFPLPADSGPNGITAGPDGNLWFTEFNGNKIGRLHPNLPPTAQPQSVTAPGDTPVTLTLTASDPDDLPAALTFTLASAPLHGTLTGFNPSTGQVTYTPATGYRGPDSFTFTVSDGAATSPPATVSLAVVAPLVSLSPSSLAFGSQQVGASSAAQTVTLTNSGNAALSVTGVSLTGANPGDFTLTNDLCTGVNLAPGASCTVDVSFRPTATGPRAANLTFVDNASDSPQRVALSGTGVTPGTPPPGVNPVLPGWSAWTSLGGILTDSPAATGFNGRVYVFAKGSDNALYMMSSADGSNFTDWQFLGGVLTDAPAAATVNGQLLVFAKGSDNALYVKTSTDGQTFSDWRRLGGSLTAPPAAAFHNGRVYVLARGTNVGTASSPVYPLWVMASADGVNYSAWQNLGGNLTAAPAATSFQGRLYVFARGIQAGNVPNPVFPGQPNPPIYPLYVTSSANGSEFSEWQNLGGNLVAAPSAASYIPPGGSETLAVYATGTDKALYERRTTDGVTYTEWQHLGGQLQGPPAAAGVNGRVYVFVRWSDNTLWERYTTP